LPAGGVALDWCAKSATLPQECAQKPAEREEFQMNWTREFPAAAFATAAR
jgi:hypothetical protein